MSIVCGIELKGNEARIVTLNGNKGEFKSIRTEFKKITVEDHKSQQEIKSFRNTLIQHFLEVRADSIGINGRATAGEHAGGVVSFKLEGLIQSCDVPVIIVYPATYTSTERKNALKVEEHVQHKYLYAALKIAFHLLED